MRQLFNWLRRRQLENDLDRELRYHLDRRIDDLRRSGLTGSEARRKARLELGGLSVMLGIGAITAIYSLVDQVLLHVLPVRQPDRLVLFYWRGNGLTTGFGTWDLMSYPICRDLDRQKQFFETHPMFPRPRDTRAAFETARGCLGNMELRP